MWQVLRSVHEACDRDYSYIVICTKALPELSSTAALLEPFMNQTGAEQPTIVLVQDGVGVEKPVQTAFPQAIILSTVVWTGANNLGNGIIEHGKLERVDIGVFTTEKRQTAKERVAWQISEKGKVADARLKSFAEVLTKGGSEVELKQEIQLARWHKNMWSVTSTIMRFTD